MSDNSAWVPEQDREPGRQRRFPPVLLNTYNPQHDVAWCPEMAVSGVGNPLRPGGLKWTSAAQFLAV